MKPASSEPVTILIAEDDDGHAELIRELLQEVGVSNPITRFRDGQDLLTFLSDPADHGIRYLILLDIRMPRVDGIEVLRQLKNDPRLKSIPVIMLTTTDDPREVERCYECGCNFYVSKPVDFARFTHVLRQLGLFLMIVHIPPSNGQRH